MNRPSKWLSKIVFSDDRSYDIGSQDKILLVGPNNSGKSLALREIRQAITSSPNHDPFELTKCIKSLQTQKSGTSKELRNYVIQNGTRDLTNLSNEMYYLGQYRLYMGAVDWFDGLQMGEFGNLFVKHISTENRLGATTMAENVAANKPKANAQQILYDNDELFEEIGGYFQDAFGVPLVLDYRGGTHIPIYVGQPPILNSGEDRITNSYVERVRELPLLSEQGDGMRGYAGILFEAIVVRHDITLVDEPEAFLHPPQMRKLARTLAEETDKQLLVSTHSSDILRGFLDATASNVRIIRLQRDGNLNISTETSTASLRELWKNPDLRYSNALEGIFHELCILCEDDSDCRFYNALSDHMDQTDPARRWPDSIYVPCGGKHSMPKLAAAMTALGVPVRVVADIDILSEAGLLKRLVEAVSGQWSAIEKDWRIVDSHVRKGIAPLSPDQMKSQIANLLSGEPGVPKSKILQVLKQDSAWSRIKSSGKGLLPKGECYAAYERLVASLKDVGIHVVPTGEIEGFLPQVGGHGPAFVSSALRLAGLGDPVFEEARTFVTQFAGPSTQPT